MEPGSPALQADLPPGKQLNTNPTVLPKGVGSPGCSPWQGCERTPSSLVRLAIPAHRPTLPVVAHGKSLLHHSFCPSLGLKCPFQGFHLSHPHATFFIALSCDFLEFCLNSQQELNASCLSSHSTLQVPLAYLLSPLLNCLPSAVLG